MLPEADRIRLRHMLEAAREALGYARGRTREDLDRDTMFFRAVVKCIEIVGEAASRLSVETKRQSRDIPWAQVGGMRNRLIHAHFDISTRTSCGGLSSKICRGLSARWRPCSMPQNGGIDPCAVHPQDGRTSAGAGDGSLCRAARPSLTPVRRPSRPQMMTRRRAVSGVAQSLLREGSGRE